MSAARNMWLSRRIPAVIAVLVLVVMVVFDYVATPPNPYRAPAILALGSGTASSGGFCGSLPD